MIRMSKVTSIFRAHPVGVLVLVALLLGGAGVAAAAMQPKKAQHLTSVRIKKGRGVSLFSHAPIIKARTASARQVPPGAIPVISAKGDETYVWHPTPAEEPQGLAQRGTPGGKYCVIQLASSGWEGQSCSPISSVEEEGLITIEGSNGSPQSVAVLVPNGVKAITTTDLNGGTNAVDVTNNVAAVEASDLSSVSFRLPGGRVRTINVREGS